MGHFMKCLTKIVLSFETGCFMKSSIFRGHLAKCPKIAKAQLSIHSPTLFNYYFNCLCTLCFQKYSVLLCFYKYKYFNYIM